MVLRRGFFSILIASILLAGCGRFQIVDGKKPELDLSIALEEATVQPGAPVYLTAKIANMGKNSVRIRNLDHSTLYFAAWPEGESAKSESTRFVEPVYSEIIKENEEITLNAGESTQRTFVFADLSLERGKYLVQATHVQADRDAEYKTFSPSIALNVSGEKVYAHRYSDGLLSKTDAIKIAAAKAGITHPNGDAVMVVDEMGLKKWWVNLYPTSDKTKDGPASQPALKSYFVDPYRAVVWREAQPFTPDIKQQGIKELPKDSKALQRLMPSRSR